jgi:hypothetical protein
MINIFRVTAKLFTMGNIRIALINMLLGSQTSALVKQPTHDAELKGSIPPAAYAKRGKIAENKNYSLYNKGKTEKNDQWERLIEK